MSESKKLSERVRVRNEGIKETQQSRMRAQERGYASFSYKKNPKRRVEQALFHEK